MVAGSWHKIASLAILSVVLLVASYVSAEERIQLETRPPPTKKSGRERILLDPLRIGIVLDQPNNLERLLNQRLFAETSYMRIVDTKSYEASLATYLAVGYRLNELARTTVHSFATLRYEPIEIVEHLTDEVLIGHGDGAYAGVAISTDVGRSIVLGAEAEAGFITIAGTHMLRSGAAGGVAASVSHRFSERFLVGLRAGYRGGSYRYSHIAVPVRLTF